MDDFDICARGRNMREAQVSVFACPGEGAVTLRVDDLARPEFWLELTLSADDLRRLLALAVVQEAPAL